MWISVRDPDTSVVLASEQVLWQDELAVRSVHRLPGAVVRAARMFRRERPDVVVSAGTGVAVGPFIAAKLMRIPTIWIETFNMTDTPGHAARLCMKLAGVVLVQRPELVSTRPRAVHIGELY